VEACEALVAGHLEVQYLVGGQWLDWSIGGVTWSVLSVQGVARLSNFKWRLKPEPLPAPAPRVSRAMELADMYLSGSQDRLRAVGLAVLAVEETLKAVRRLGDARGFGQGLGSDLSQLLDRARAAMLGAEAGK
jgi:hypothetical protein